MSYKCESTKRKKQKLNGYSIILIVGKGQTKLISIKKYTKRNSFRSFLIPIFQALHDFFQERWKLINKTEHSLLRSLQL